MTARRRSGNASPGPWKRFTRRYGWRAYALPVLVLLTVAMSVRIVGDSSDGSRARATTGASGSVTVEGLVGDGSKYQPAATPPPIVIHLGADARTCADNSYPKLLLVSLSKQHMWACEGAKQVNSTAVTTGKVVSGDQTPLGSWRVEGKQTDRYLVGPGYRDYVHYWVPFNGDFGIHDAPWQTMPYGSQDYRTQGSHGCVHVPEKTMDWVYQWAEVGQTVVTIAP